MINRRAAALLVLLAPLVACVSGTSGSGDSNPNAGFQARFVPLGGIMPFPNDLYFNGSTTGTLNIPGSATVAQNGPLLEMNHLDGFGTQSDISIYFTQPVDATSLAANVFVFKVSSDAATKGINPEAPAGTGSLNQLTVGTDYSIGLSPGIDSAGEIVTIKPLKPLVASTVNGTTPIPATYLVVVTNGVKDSTGAAVTPSSDYAAILAADLPVLAGGKMGTTGNPALDQVALFTLPQIVDAAESKLLDPTKIAVTFSFSTQYLNLSLTALALSATPTAQPAGVGIVDTGLTTFDALAGAGETLTGTAAAVAKMSEVYAGTVALPYYLTVPATGSTAALTDSWHNAKGGDIALNATDVTSFVPKATVAQNVIPILVSIPNAASPCAGVMPGGGWPVVVFQHGITRNREDMLAVAGTFASQCVAVIAIDLPLHGVTNTKDPLYLKGHERTFDMSATGVAGATGTNIGGSGAQFINLTSTITSRDNLREGAADLYNLVTTLPTLAAIGPTAPTVTNTFNPAEVFYVGHSLGGIIGTTFLGIDSVVALTNSASPKILAATLANPGGHIAELLRTSAEFEPIIDAGLAQQGLVKGTQSYYDFYSEAQAVVDDGDPANYAFLASIKHPIHMVEVVGGLNGKTDTCNLPDQVVPNSSTDLLVTLMGLTQVDTTSAGSKFIVRFLAGDHGSILNPALPANCTNNTTNQLIYGAVTLEMQTEMASFLLGGGTGVPINNTPPIVQAP